MRTPGTIEVSEADYRRLVDERRGLLAALKNLLHKRTPSSEQDALNAIGLAERE